MRVIRILEGFIRDLFIQNVHILQLKPWRFWIEEKWIRIGFEKVENIFFNVKSPVSPRQGNWGERERGC
jgi:hypothetical protein